MCLRGRASGALLHPAIAEVRRAIPERGVAAIDEGMAGANGTVEAIIQLHTTDRRTLGLSAQDDTHTPVQLIRYETRGA